MTQIVQTIETPDRVELEAVTEDQLRTSMTVFVTDHNSLRVLVEVRTGEYVFTHLLGADVGVLPSGYDCMIARETGSPGCDLSFASATPRLAVRKALKAGLDVHTFQTGAEAAAWWLDVLTARRRG